MSKSLEILNRKAPNTAGLLVLNPQEVETIKGELAAYDRYIDRSIFAAQEKEGALEAKISKLRESLEALVEYAAEALGYRDSNFGRDRARNREIAETMERDITAARELLGQ